MQHCLIGVLAGFLSSGALVLIEAEVFGWAAGLVALSGVGRGGGWHRAHREGQGFYLVSLFLYLSTWREGEGRGQLPASRGMVHAFIFFEEIITKSSTYVRNMLVGMPLRRTVFSRGLLRPMLLFFSRFSPFSLFSLVFPLFSLFFSF